MLGPDSLRLGKVLAASLVVREPNYDNCLDLTFVAFPHDEVIIVPDSTLDMQSPGSFQNIGL